jgi:hypothetical protein
MPYNREIQVMCKNKDGSKEINTVNVVTLRKRGQDYFHSVIREALIKEKGKNLYEK